MSGTKLWDLINDCERVEEYLLDEGDDEYARLALKAFQRIQEFIVEAYEEEKEHAFGFGIIPRKINKEK